MATKLTAHSEVCGISVDMAEHDPSPHVQIMAAHAIAGLGEPEKGVVQLAAILDKEESLPLRLQAMTALTLIGEPARAALASIQKAAQVDQEYLRSSGRYLLAVLDGTYKPGYETLDRAWFDKHVGAFIGHPMPSPTY